ncbi:GIY-YIG nuclease family protein [Jiangella alba]|uniref:GIY-YIG nuclease family protein n=1 Tax=Jiangella alba TaxID=561176 RepID=UPI001C0D7AA3|nr:hypothetical protein [Jiangella alba]
MRARLRTHFRGNASGSTFRLTLGSLLAETIGLRLRRVGRTGRLTFSDGEWVLSEWMARHARVCWLPTASPWLLESELIGRLALPLDLDQNQGGAFHAALSPQRQRADQPPSRTRSVPVIDWAAGLAR